MSYIKINKTKNFLKNTKGNMSIIFALTLLAIISTIGISIDFSRLNHSENTLQLSMDSIVLALAKDISKNQNLKDSASARDSYIAAWINRTPKLQSLQPTFTSNLDNKNVLSINASATIDMTLMQLVGYENVTVNIYTEAVASTGKAEIALVLDTTGSMDGPKLASLRNAAKNFTKTLFNQPNSAQNLKMAVVPFGQYVNVGKNYKNAPWLNKPADQVDTWTYDTFCRKINFNAVCRDVRRNCNSNDPEIGCWSQALNWCNNGGPSQSECRQLQRTSTITWEGCVKPRAFPYSENDDFASYNNQTKYPGKLGWCSSKKMLPLKTNKNKVINRINELTWGYGETHIPIGLSWGWHLLSNDRPFRQGAASSETEWNKYVVLMSDGENTKHDPNDWSNIIPDPDADQTMANLCTNMKAAGIKIFTIAFDITDIAVKDRLKACASKNSYYFDAANGVSLIAAFNSVSDSISNLRISR